jgi:alpha-1,3/alpha-1,6-mannosyltransferase
VDQISHTIPLLRWIGKPVVFYCHFPDLLLTDRASALKQAYRFFIDRMEEITTRQADRILVNSIFTESVVRSTFRSLADAELTVLNPAVSLAPTLASGASVEDEKWTNWDASSDVLILSINRFERKKCIETAVEAFANLRNRLKDSDLEHRCKLMLAGGYDLRVDENVQYDLELRRLCVKMDLQTSDYPDFSGPVIFFHSFTDAQKGLLLRTCKFVVYTPPNEHFGIVPIEAMFSGKPVIGCASGGVLESVSNNVTGLLCESPFVETFSSSMETLIRDPNLIERMGSAGMERVRQKFTLETYARQLYDVFSTAIEGRRTKSE